VYVYIITFSCIFSVVNFKNENLNYSITGWAIYFSPPRSLVQHLQISTAPNQQWHSTWCL